MSAAGDRCKECGELFNLVTRVFRASGGGLRCARCERKAQIAATCCRGQCDVRTLCTTINACAAANPQLVLELATRITKLAHDQAPPAVVARRRAS